MLISWHRFLLFTELKCGHFFVELRFYVNLDVGLHMGVIFATVHDSHSKCVLVMCRSLTSVSFLEEKRKHSIKYICTGLSMPHWHGNEIQLINYFCFISSLWENVLICSGACILIKYCEIWCAVLNLQTVHSLQIPNEKFLDPWVGYITVWKIDRIYQVILFINTAFNPPNPKLSRLLSIFQVEATD